MKKAILILIILILALLYYMGVLTRKETLPFSKEFFSVESPASTDRTWEIKKNTSLSRQELDQLYQLKLDKWILNVPTLSFLLMRQSEQARGKGDADQAVQMALYAITFSPDLPQPRFELARALWHQNFFQLHQILPEVLKGVIVHFQYYPSSLKLLYNVFYIFSNAILMSFIIFSIVLMVKYLPLYFYDIRKNVSQETSGIVINSIKILVFFIPFFLRLDMLWALFFWSVLLWGYVTKKDKQFIFVFLVILVYFPFFLRSFSSFLDSGSSDIILEMNQMNHEDWGKTTEEKLRNWLVTHPDDSEVVFTLGLAAKRQGRYPDAEEFYRKAIQLDPKFSEAFSNLGNVYLAQKQTALAISSYQQAIDLDPSQGAYHFNLHRAYSQESFLSGKVDRALQRAQQLDPELVRFYMAIDSPHPNRLMIDMVLTDRRLWKRFLNQFIGREGFSFRLFKAWFERIPSRIPLLTPILFLGFLIGMARYCRAKRFLTRCPMCGSPTYRFYLGTSDQEFICFNCYRIFIQKEKLHPKIVEKKSYQVRQFQKQDHSVTRFLSFFFAGFGYLWREQVLRGLIFLLIFFIFVLKFVYWNGVIPSSLPQMSFTVWKWIFWGGLFTVFYVPSIRMLYRLKPKFEAGSEKPRGYTKPIPANRRPVE